MFIAIDFIIVIELILFSPYDYKHSAPNGAFALQSPACKTRSLIQPIDPDRSLANAGDTRHRRTARHVFVVQRVRRRSRVNQRMAPQRNRRRLVDAICANRIRRGYALKRTVQSSGYHQSPTFVHAYGDLWCGSQRRVWMVRA